MTWERVVKGMRKEVINAVTQSAATGLPLVLFKNEMLKLVNE